MSTTDTDIPAVAALAGTGEPAGSAGAQASAAPDTHAGGAGACPAAPAASVQAPRLLPAQEEAWVGFLVAHSEIMRALDAGLTAEFGLSVSNHLRLFGLSP